MKRSHSEIRLPRLHTVVAEHIRKDYILQSKAGQRLPSEAELASTYLVSIPTVREALRSLSQAGLVDRRQGSGTYRAETPKEKTSVERKEKIVAIACPMNLTHGGISCYFIQLALYTGKCLKAMGISSQIYYGEGQPNELPKFDDGLLRKDIENGLIDAAITICDDGNAAYKDLLKEKSIPTVAFGQCCNSMGKPLMEDFMDQAISYLIGHKKRKLACIGLGKPMGISSSSRFRELVEKHNGITDESWILGDLHPNQNGAGYSLMRELWSRGSVKPDGLVLCDDVFFQDIALAVAELKISVPNNLIVVSHANIGVRFVAPFQVVRFEMNSIEIARQIAERMQSLLSGSLVDPSEPFKQDYVLKDPFSEESISATEDSPVLPHAGGVASQALGHV